MKKRDFSAKSLFLRYELLLFACVFLLIIGILAYTNYSYQRNLENTTGTTVRYYINSKEEMMSNVEHVLFNIAANDYSLYNRSNAGLLQCLSGKGKTEYVVG